MPVLVEDHHAFSVVQTTNVLRSTRQMLGPELDPHSSPCDPNVHCLLTQVAI